MVIQKCIRHEIKQVYRKKSKEYQKKLVYIRSTSIKYYRNIVHCQLFTGTLSKKIYINKKMFMLMVEFSVIIGSTGVLLLLLAFLLNLFKILMQDTKTYAILNVVGAGLSCYASVLIDYMPFVILEGTWALVAFVGLVKLLKTPDKA